MRTTRSTTRRTPPVARYILAGTAVIVLGTVIAIAAVRYSKLDCPLQGSLIDPSVPEKPPAVRGRTLPDLNVEIPDGIRYTLLDQEHRDKRVLGFWFEASVLVEGDITELALEQLLGNLYDLATELPGNNFHPHPTGVSLYAFASRERWESDWRWIAMLHASPGSAAKVTINEAQLEHLYDEPVERFGLSEDRRKQVFRDVVAAQDRADCEAEQSHPSVELGEPGWESETMREKPLDDRRDFRDELLREFYGDIRRHYDLTEVQLEATSDEGTEKDWPFPPFQKCKEQ